MLFSLSWLESLCPVRTSPGEIAEILTARGLTVDAVSDHADDRVLDVDVPANRPDCLGHLGLARELSAATGVPLEPRPERPSGGPDCTADLVRVLIDEPELCPRYAGCVCTGVRIGPSPAWLVKRLEVCGLRSVNNVVDASNVVLLELGHPIHTFDLDRIEEATIRVRRAAEGESLTTLDGERRGLLPDDLVIADARRPVALAGVIGGAATEIHEGTRRVLIEAASFLPRAVRATARRFGIRTDASYRFERGVPPESVPEAQAMALRLLSEVAGATPASGIVDVDPLPRSPRRLILRNDRVRVLLGYDPGEETVLRALRALELSPEAVGPGQVQVTVPYWRNDLCHEADLVEEVARHVGYDGIPMGLPEIGSAPAPPDPAQRIEERARDVAAFLGFGEALNYAMIGEGEDDPFLPAHTPSPVGLANPIAEPLARLRRTLLPGLVSAADRNLRRGVRDVRLFEVGRVFLRRAGGGFPDERLRAALVWAGAAGPRLGSASAPAAGFHHLSGVVETWLAALGVAADTLRVTSARLPGLHPGRSATWLDAAERALGWGGELHPDLRRERDISAPLYLAEVDLSSLISEPPPIPMHRPVPRVPAVSRDLSIVLGTDLTFEAVLATLRSVPAPARVRFEAVDRYEGEPLERGQVSLSVRVTLEPLDKSLTDEETETYRTALVRALKGRLGVRLRE